MKIFTSVTNTAFLDFYPNLPKAFSIHKTGKNKAPTWNKMEGLIKTSTLKIPEIEICNSNQSFCNFTQIDRKLSSISKWAKLKLAKWAKSKTIL